MRKIILLCCGILLFPLSQQVIAAPHKVLNNYAELLSALKQGDTIRAVIVLNKCSPSSAKLQTSDDILWSIDFTNFYKAKFNHNGQLAEGIAVAYNKLKQTENGPIYDYARIRLFADGTIEGTSEVINPKDFTSLSKTTYSCNLDNNVVTLYDIDN